MDAGLAALYAAAIGVAGVVAGVLLGLLAEPIKARVENRNKLALLRRSLYGELGYNYMVLVGFLERTKMADNQEIMTMAHSILRFESYNYGKENPLLFYQLKEAADINTCYIFLNFSIEGKRPLAEYVSTIEDNLQEGSLNKRLMYAICGKEFIELIEQQEAKRANLPSKP